MKRLVEKAAFYLLLNITVILCFASRSYAQFAYKNILQGEDEVRIPFEYVEGFILMEVELNNAIPLKFIFDTGAENTVLLEKLYADILKLEYEEEIKVIGADNSTLNTAYISRRVPFSFEKGGSFLTDILVLEEQKIDFVDIIGRRIDGIIGGNVLIGAVVEIDYKKQELIFHDSDSFKPTRKLHKEKINIIDQRPFVQSKVKISDTSDLEVRLLMDTGAGLHLLLEEGSHPEIVMPDSVIDGRIGEGLGGYMGGFLGNVERFSVLDENLQNIPIYFHRKDTLEITNFRKVKRNGLIGNLYWQNHKVIIDYSKQYLYSRANRKKPRKFRFNKSGLVILASGEEFEEFRIKHVNKGSPADLANLQAGDRLISMNRIPTQLLNLTLINRKLSGKENAKVRVKVLRNGKKIVAEFQLKTKKIRTE